jgi:hypothetical protein
MATTGNIQENLDSPTALECKEKTTPGISVRESENDDDVHGEVGAVQWQTGVRARFPWLGFGAMTTMLICIALTGVVLGTSRGKARQEWPAPPSIQWKNSYWKEKSQVAPNVLLALINTVTNISLAIAIGQGVAIAWWRRAMKGSTVEDLHRSWGFSASVLELLTAGRKFNMIALAALMAKLALVDNVFLQKATSASPGWYRQKNVVMTLPVARQLPQDYVGVLTSNESTVSPTLAFS